MEESAQGGKSIDSTLVYLNETVQNLKTLGRFVAATVESSPN